MEEQKENKPIETTENKENQKGFYRVISWFKDQNIEIPIDVGNSIQDAFNENDNLNNEISLYLKEDAETFCDDMTLTKTVNTRLKKPSDGHSDDVYTYFGNINFVLNEYTNLYDEDGNIIEQITNIKNPNRTKIDVNNWAVIVIDSLDWSNDISVRTSKLYIYCPVTPEKEN